MSHEFRFIAFMVFIGLAAFLASLSTPHTEKRRRQ